MPAPTTRLTRVEHTTITTFTRGNPEVHSRVEVWASIVDDLGDLTGDTRDGDITVCPDKLKARRTSTSSWEVWVTGPRRLTSGNTGDPCTVRLDPPPAWAVDLAEKASR